MYLKARAKGLEEPSKEKYCASNRSMEYKRFIIDAFEREPGRWRARVSRRSGKPLIAARPPKLQAFVTGIDSNSASEAMVLAMAAIDAGMFFRKTTRSTEKFWRRGGKYPPR